ncbi:MAG TPA: DUF924 family protein [Dongiaceae bacterium]|jgi:uncharacterized protein (DUF924 family)
MPLSTPTEVLDFWFSDHARARWFVRDAAFDEEIRSRFGDSVRAAATGELDRWVATAPGALALVILLDQFPRNLFRGSARAFAADARARAVAGEAIARRLDQETPLDRRKFFYLPFEHSEIPADQDRCIALFQAWVDAHDGAAREAATEMMPWVLRHAEIIRRFGRFPHRNEALGRESTEAEIAFLREPMSSF